MTSRAAPRGRNVRGILAAVGIVGALAVAGFLAWTVTHLLPDLSRFDAAIESAAREFRLDPDLIRGVVAAESSGNPDAVSPKGARGLMQLMPRTAREQATRLGMKEPQDDRLFVPEVNLRLGASYLASLLQRYGGSEEFAVAAYNAGPGRLDDWRTKMPDADPATVINLEGFPETRAYLRRVLSFRERYRSSR